MSSGCMGVVKSGGHESDISALEKKKMVAS